MEELKRLNSGLKSGFSRREFLGKTAAAAAGFSIVPRHVLGGAGFVPPSDKVNIAFIGVGAQGLRRELSAVGYARILQIGASFVGRAERMGLAQS
jgi:hypothetical protein